MGRILLIAAAVVVGFFVIGAVIGFIFSALKWVLIIGFFALIATLVLRFTKSGRSESQSQPY
jgi:hypothetical protein